MIGHRNKVLALGPLALLLSALLPGVARADDDPSAAETAAARSLAIDGLKLAKAGQCEEAIDKLERAEKLHHSPIVMARLGECYITQGKLVQGSELLRKVLREPAPTETSPALEQARERAQTLIRETKPKIAALTLTVNGAKDAAISVTVDGDAVPSTVLGVELPVDPGEHAIEATAPGYFKATGKTTLISGEKRAFVLELKPDPNAAVSAPSPTPAASGERKGPVRFESAPRISRVNAPAEPPEDSATGKTLAYVSYGVGVAGIGVGLVFGRAAMQERDQLDRECPGRVCDSGHQSRLDGAKTKGLVSTICFGVGGAGALLGTVFLLTSGSPASASASQSLPQRQRAFDFHPRAAVGLGRVELGADF
jgi:hypothetical protein